MINPLQIGDALQRFLAKRTLAIERVQDDSFEQVTEREVMIVCQRPEHLQKPLLDAHTRLDPYDIESIATFSPVVALLFSPFSSGLLGHVH